MYNLVYSNFSGKIDFNNKQARRKGHSWLSESYKSNEI